MKRILLSALASALAGSLLHAAPLQVFILSGQSNMQGHASVTTFDSLASDPETAPLLEQMRDADGNPVVLDRTWITYLSEDRGGNPTVKEGSLTAGFGARDDTIGPEFTFGIAMENFIDAPILIIKAAWGGKNLHTDFRPPSAADEPAGAYYQRMMAHVESVLEDPGKVVPGYDPAQGYELAGFVWFQGWNDLTDSNTYPERGNPGGYDQYTENLVHIIRDIRGELEAPELPFVVGVLGVGGPTADYESPRFAGIHQNFRDAMAAPAEMPEFRGNVANVLTEKFWDHELARVRSISADERTPEEQETARGISNQEFHYLGAANIFAPMGVAFAEALHDLR